jgi:hypothetical protein
VSVLNDFLDFMSNFDLISPAASLIQDALNGPSADFGIPAHVGWTRRRIKNLLSRHGIKAWGFTFDHDLLVFSVRKAQARWTYYLLDRAGIPIAYAPSEAVDAPAKQGQKLTSGESLLDMLFGFLDRLG